MTEEIKVPYFATVNKYKRENFEKKPLTELLEVVEILKNYPEIQTDLISDLGLTGENRGTLKSYKIN